MKQITSKDKLTKYFLGLSGLSMVVSSNVAFAVNPVDPDAPCAFLPADRTTEFHGNPNHSSLNLGMAGNQWVVFDKVMQGFNLYQGSGDGNEPTHHDNGYWTLNELDAQSRQYYIQLIPPGQIKTQIISGCMVLGNDDTRNFLPTNIRVDFDVYSSTTYNDMKDLGQRGFITEAVPYIKNKLDLMVASGNPLEIGTSGLPALGSVDNIFDIVMDLLEDCDDTNANGICDAQESMGGSMGIRVSEVDHISEGVHNAINRMYQAMDEYIREHGSPEQKAALTAALMAVNMPKCGSPADTRADWPGIPPAGDIDGTLNCVGPDKFKLANNVQCFYSGHPEIADNTLKLCEFAILNKTNTHETRVHHVETPNGILGGSVDVGPVWTSELKYAQSHGSSVDGMQGNVPAGVPTPPDSDPVVNNPAVYSIAVLTNAKKPGKARQFIDFVRSSMGQDIYENQGGFIRLDPSEMDGGRCYDSKGVETIRDGRCP